MKIPRGQATKAYTCAIALIRKGPFLTKPRQTQHMASQVAKDIASGCTVHVHVLHVSYANVNGGGGAHGMNPVRSVCVEEGRKTLYVMLLATERNEAPN